MLLIFDLDGTLIDSSEDLAISVNAALTHVGRPVLGHDVIHSYVGNGAPTLIRRAVGAGTPEETEAEALAFFLKFYRAHALEHTRLYDGVRDALDNGRGQGHAMAVLTNKPTRISQDIITSLGLAEHFFRVYGGDSFEQKKPDPIGIKALREESGYAADTTLMIGDSGVDIQTARNAGVRSCGVLWGFQPEAFEHTPPDYLVQTALDLQELWQADRVT